MVLAPPQQLFADGARLGRYLIERRIASGGMADVYLAKQVGEFGFTKTVALKVLKTEVSGDDDNVRMFLREALVAAEFNHPNLVPVYEVGREGGRLFLAMELVRGVSVATLMLLLAKKGRSIPIPLAVRIARDVLDGLAYAHEAKGADGSPLDIIHRDVTPQNVLIAEDGAVKLVDFGIARAETALGRTQVAKVKGKFSYMSPEQWEPAGRTLDARADLFSLGVSLYEMSTGSGRLFKGSAAPDLYKAVVRDPILPPSSRVADYPDDLSAAVMTALERDVSKRWPSARSMSAALDGVMAAHEWNVETAVLAKLVEFALDGQSIESRWERVDSGDVAQLDHDTPTMVDSAGSGPLRPVSVFPRAMEALRARTPVPASSVVMGSLPPQAVEPAYELGAPKKVVDEAPAPEAVAPPQSSSRAMRRAVLAVAIAGWATAAVTGSLWLSESRRAASLERRLAMRNAVAVATPPPPPASTLVVPLPADGGPTSAAVTAPPVVGDTLTVVADPALATTLATAWARAFAQGPGGTRVALTPGDARAAMAAGRSMLGLFVAAGTEPRAATERVVGYEATAVVVHPSSPVRAMTVAQLAELFGGRITTWRALRGADAAPQLVISPTGAAPHAALRSLVLARATPSLALAPTADTVDDDAAAVRAVAADPTAVAVVALGAVTPGVRALALTGGRGPAVAPTAVAVRTLRYPLVQAVVLARNGAHAPTRAMEGFTALTTSPAGQGLLTRAGFVGR